MKRFGHWSKWAIGMAAKPEHTSIGNCVTTTTRQPKAPTQFAEECRKQLEQYAKKARSTPRVTSLSLARRSMISDDEKSSDDVRPSAPPASDMGEA
jgi:hypothetical protein